MERIYLDNAAATPVSGAVVDAMSPFWGDVYGNPSSIHREGVMANTAVGDARKVIATELSCNAEEIHFTGSATESCNLALIGTVRAWKRKHPTETPHIVVSAIEHDAVLSTARFLESEGARLSIVGTNEEGIVDVHALIKELTMQTVVVSIMYANNEIGVIQPLREIAHKIRVWKKNMRGVSRDVHAEGDARYPLFHTDACQATNYCEVNTPQLGVDLLTLNASKIYGPKGVALLLVKKDTQIDPVIVGGGHESGLRAGTENVPLIVGFASALQQCSTMRETESARLRIIRDFLIARLQEIDSIIINGSVASRLPNNVNFTLRGADHEFLALALDARGIAVSTKSACNENDAEKSHVLQALIDGGGTGHVSGIRVSMGRQTTMKDIEYFIESLTLIKDNLIIGA